jgi:hypothetical protein
MAPLFKSMSHSDAAEHLRGEVIQVAEHEVRPLLCLPATGYFSAALLTMCGVDHVGALYGGWDGHNRRQIASTAKARVFLTDVMAPATGLSSYRTYAPHLVEIYRMGLVHLRAPKVFTASHRSTAELTWALMDDRTGEHLSTPAGPVAADHLVPVRVSKDRTALPLSVVALHEDFLVSCEWFATQLLQEANSSTTVLIDRWRSTADALSAPEQTSLTW